MTERDDHQLLGEFARNGSQPAFAALIERYVGLVYSVAWRSTGNTHQAEEITQAVFIILAQKADGLSPRVILSGWLYQTAGLTSANFIKSEIRRQRREQEAYMQSSLNEPGDEAAWQTLAPLLDEAMGNLGQTDRDAVVLRYFQNKTAAEIGAALRMNEETARRRVNRAMDKLRKFFGRRGVHSSAAVIAAAISANSVQAAPVALAKSVTAVAVVKGSLASASTLALVKGTLSWIAWAKAKSALLVGTGIVLAGTAAVTVDAECQAHQRELQARDIAEQMHVIRDQEQSLRAQAQQPGLSPEEHAQLQDKLHQLRAQQNQLRQQQDKLKPNQH